MEGNYTDGIGNVRISEEVVATIASVAALEVEGVCSLVPYSGGDIKKLITSKRNPGKVAKIDLAGGEITVELGVVLSYGVRMQEVIGKMQSEVKYAVESMTGMKVRAVNVYVQGIGDDEKKTKREEKREEKHEEKTEE
ncbi:MAG TPA: Asp23/Gls24 family envelope stress response protein [Terriglobales bacterium]|nr:Asp23/Gls24 family envelope stress response protein [Terriglobales bacterium]